MHIYQDAEKFIKDQFHKGSYDGRSKFDVGAIVGDALVAKVDAADPYHDPIPGVVHASQLYGCLRGVFYEMMGVTEDAQETFNKRRMAGVFEAGHLFEEFVVNSLGDRVLERQREYLDKYKSLTLVGHSDYRIDDEGIMRIGENKSVHSQAFHYRREEGTLVAWQNQIQLQIYMWLERVLFNNEWEGIFSYISKDDCMIDHAPVKFNQAIIDEVVIPILDMLNDAFEKARPIVEEREALLKQEIEVAARLEKNGNDGADVEEMAQITKALSQTMSSIIEIGKQLPLPDMAVYDASRGSFSTNWLCKYCKFHNTCAGAGWLLEAGAEVKRRNAEQKASVVKSMGGTPDPVKPKIGIAAE